STATAYDGRDLGRMRSEPADVMMVNVQIRALRPSTVDLAIAVALLMLVGPASIGLVRGAESAVVICFALLTLALTICVGLRRVWPLGSFLCAVFVMAGLLLLPDLPEGASYIFAPVSALYLVMVYTLAAETGALRLPLVTSALGLGLIVLRSLVGSPGPTDAAFWIFIPAAAAAVAASWAFGAYRRARHELWERHLEEGARKERELLAHEVHDVVAHSLAVMVTQSDAALMVLDQDPVKARSMMENSLRTGRAAMAEMRRMVTDLRDRPSLVGPVHSLAGLGVLVASLRSDAVRVDLIESGDLEGVGGDTARAAHRIIQESLTNAVKHVPAPVQCRVSVDVTPRQVLVTVCDNGPGFSPDCFGVGHGLVGMQERARSVGGSLAIANASGTCITAELPR
ncbi:MAG: histidine kinase, partial [Nocardioides sp.]|nr:histidine kinase [Nocardioides sp.]